MMYSNHIPMKYDNYKDLDFIDLNLSLDKTL